MKMKRWIIFLMATTFFSSAYAGVIGRGFVQNSSGSGSGDDGTYRPAPGDGKPVDSGIDTEQCNETADHFKGDLFPLGLLYNTMDSNKGVELEVGNDGTGRVILPSYINNCFKPKSVTRKLGNDVVVGIRNTYEFKPEEVYTPQELGEILKEADIIKYTSGTKPSDSQILDFIKGMDADAKAKADAAFAKKMDKMKSYEKYEKCLDIKGLIKDGSFDRQKATMTHRAPIDFKIEDFETANSSQIYYADPLYPRGYDAPFGYTDKKMPTDGSMGVLTCANVAHMTSKPMFAYKSKESESYESAKEACNTSDYERVLEEIARLEESTVGNAVPLLNILRKVLVSLREEEAEKIYEKMEDIEEKLAPDDDDLAEGKRVGLEKKEAKKAVREFLTQVERLDRLVINPSLKELKKLLEKREDADDDEKEEIDERIEELNELIAEFGKKEADFTSVYRAMEEYAFTKEAEDIQEISLVSQEYGRVYEGDRDEDRGKPQTIERANKNIHKRLKSFKSNTLARWTRRKQVKDGNKTPILVAQKRYDARVKKLKNDYTSYQKREQADYKRYCGSNFFGGVKNPIRCNIFQNGYQGRMDAYLRTRARDLKYIQAGRGELDDLNSLYASEMRRRIASTGVDSIFSSSSSYSDPLGLYTNPYTTSSGTTFDASLFGTTGLGNDAMFNLGGPQYQQLLMMSGQGPGARAPMMNTNAFSLGF